MPAVDGSTTSRAAVIDPTSDDRWDPFVRSHPDGSIFHGSAWARVLMASYRYRPRYQVLEDSEQRIVAALPLMLVSSRLTGRRLETMLSSPSCLPS